MRGTDTKSKHRFLGEGHWRDRIRILMNHSPLWLSFTFLMAFFLGIMAIMLSFSNYRWSTRNAIQNQETSTMKYIDLKLISIDSNLKELSDIAVLPVYDTELYHSILSEEPLPAETLTDIFQTISRNYFTRTDLTAYRIDLLNQDVSIGRSTSDQHMRLYPSSNRRYTEAYRRCTSSATNDAIFPADTDASVLKFCQTIIRISDRKPAALITLEVNRDVISRGFSNQMVALYNPQGELVFTNAKGEDASRIRSGNLLPLQGSKHTTFAANSSSMKDTVLIGDQPYLYATGISEDSQLALVVWTPLSSITQELHNIRLFSILQGLLFLLIALVITLILIRYLTAPLSTLAGFQSQMAVGNFQRINIGRCKETAELSESFNDMSDHISRLVNDNLLSSLNEKNARIEALEAQVNPHFLYNTLQAIGSVALMNDQEEIYLMLTKLAANMRYSIKGGNEVTLDQELNFTDNYIALQKLRMEDRLRVTRKIEPGLGSARIPKCSLQVIVENSIKYGLQGDISNLDLEIDAFRQGNTLVIRVRDNGAGMDPQRLLEVQNKIHHYKPGDTASSASAEGGIGLVNLYARLRIMYDNHADLKIESSNGENHYTSTTLLLEDSED